MTVVHPSEHWFGQLPEGLPFKGFSGNVRVIDTPDNFARVELDDEDKRQFYVGVHDGAIVPVSEVGEV